MPAEQAIEAMRRAVRCNVFPLFEVRDGTETTITMFPRDPLPIEDYFALQGRFKPLLADATMLDQVRASVTERWESLVERHERTRDRLATAAT
jgi:pyruvate/2-oxoacid:ferredoxin oxidoreductase beta subunit